MNQSYTDQLKKCECCPRGCRVNRLEGKIGFCGVGSCIQISHAGLHFGEEPPISGTRGSGTIFFSGCNLRCVFCQNFQISQEFQQGRTKTVTTDELAFEILRLQDKGAHNINFVSPSHMIFQMAAAIQLAKRRGLVIPVLYNSNGYDSVDALRQIRGLVDIYVPDIKYMENRSGEKYSYVDDYADIVPGVIEEMLNQAGFLVMGRDGIAVRGLLVRHLVLPGHLQNSRQCLSFLTGLSPDIHVSIMSQYSPQYKARGFSGINRTLTEDEYDEITDYALELGMGNVFIQKLESQAHFLPDFDQERPFNPT